MGGKIVQKETFIKFKKKKSLKKGPSIKKKWYFFFVILLSFLVNLDENITRAVH